MKPTKTSAANYDPNSHVDPELRERALRESLFVFYRANLVPKRVTSPLGSSIISTSIGMLPILVYVRVTEEDDDVSGTGPEPGVLRELGREWGARCFVVRVHFHRVEGRLERELFGFGPLELVLEREAKEWRSKVLGPLGGGAPTLSKLELELVQAKSGDPYPWPADRTPDPELESMLEWPALLQSLSKPSPGQPGPGAVYGRFRISGHPELDDFSVGLSDLIASLTSCEPLNILTCTCGINMCAGISDVRVWRERGLVFWYYRLADGEGRSECRLVFEEAQYRQEVLSNALLAVKLHASLPPGAFFLTESESPERVKELLTAAENPEWQLKAPDPEAFGPAELNMF